MMNDHHGSDGKFAGNVRARERAIKEFQYEHLLAVTGTIDDATRNLLDLMNKAADE